MDELVVPSYEEWVAGVAQWLGIVLEEGDSLHITFNS